MKVGNITAKTGISKDPEVDKLGAVVHLWVDREPDGDPDFVWVDKARFPMDKSNKVRRHILKNIKPKLRGMIKDLQEKIKNERSRPDEMDIVFGTVRVRAAAQKTDDGYIVEVMIPLNAENFPAGEWKPGRVIRMSILLNDDDRAEIHGRDYSLNWGGTARNFMDTTGWIPLKMSAKE